MLREKYFCDFHSGEKYFSPNKMEAKIREIGNPKLEKWYQEQYYLMESIINHAMKSPISKWEPGSHEKVEKMLIEYFKRIKPKIPQDLLEGAIDAHFDDFIAVVLEYDAVIPRKATSLKPKTEKEHHVGFEKLPIELNVIENPGRLMKRLHLKLKYPQPEYGKDVKTKTFRTSFDPITKILPSDYVETGMEQKIGGHVPYFEKNLAWPVDHWGDPLTFFAQFLDPRKVGEVELIQIWMPDIGEGDLEAGFIRKIPNPNPAEQKIIPEPKNVPNKKVGSHMVSGMLREGMEIDLIIGWKKVTEINREEVAEAFGEDYKSAGTAIEELGGLGIDSNEFKLGGFGNTSQGIIYTYPYQNIYAGLWGDGGSIHSDENGDLNGDMG